MKLFQVLQTKSKAFYGYVLLLSLVRSMLQSVILILINNIAAGQQLPILPGYEWLVFIIMVAGTVFLNKLFQTYMITLTQTILFELEINILKRLRFTSYESLENFGNAKVYAVMGDIRTLANIPLTFANCFNAVIVILCSLIYLFYLSTVGAAIVLGIIILLAFFYTVRNKWIEKDLNRMRDLQNEFYRYLTDFVNGFKEIKMSQTRSRNIYTQYLERNRTHGRQLGTSTSIQYLNNELTGQYSWYLVLGAIMFILPLFIQLDAAQMTTMIVTILFIMSPVAFLVISLPHYTNAKIALRRIQEFEDKMEPWNKELELRENAGSPDDTFQSIEMRGVTYEYADEEKARTFVVGPIDVEIKKGELVFITGGNGSGKSTFIKLLTGLYKPTQGGLYWNSQHVTDAQYPFYRDQISAIFTDYHLPQENYTDFDISTSNQRLNEYLKLMGLTNIFHVAEGKYLFSNKLSKGQQKRLAFIYALLEERQILVLDEWAAEQDIYFRHYFYHTLIPMLLQMNKTIVLVTHDSGFSADAGRVLEFDFGTIISDRKIAEGNIYQNVK